MSLILQTAIPFLVGTKFDTFSTFPRDEQEEITKQVNTAFFHISSALADHKYMP